MLRAFQKPTLSQPFTSEMLLDAWPKGCLQRICSYALHPLHICLVLQKHSKDAGMYSGENVGTGPESELEFDSALCKQGVSLGPCYIII